MTAAGLLQRLPGLPRQPIDFELNGRPCTGFDGDTVLTAMLTLSSSLREADISGAPRAGFCFIGACQDCWVMSAPRPTNTSSAPQGGMSKVAEPHLLKSASGQRLRACTTLLEAGMRLRTTAVR